MTRLSDLNTALDNLASELATESANPRPNYSVDGRSISWSEYRASLIKEMKELNDLIIAMTGAVELRTNVLG